MAISLKGPILVAGGTGLIGSRLCRLLADKGYAVRILSRNNKPKSKYTTYYWNPSSNQIDEEAVKDAVAIINLAGSGIADHRWTAKYKQEILESRLQAISTLLPAIRKHTAVKVYIGASAIGYYGNRGDEILDENKIAGSDFLSQTTTRWEAASENCSVRRVIIRTGIVLTPQGGALPPLARPVRAMIAPVIGGDQYMSWIHIDDLCNFYINALENENWNGIYNAVVPEAIRHREFVKILKDVLNPQAIPLRVPPSFLKLILGEQSTVILDSVRATTSRAIAQGFTFHYTSLASALKNLYGV